LHRLREKLTIGGYHSEYEERIRAKSVLQKLFEGTEYENRMEQIQNLMEGEEKAMKVIYLRSLHMFGRKDGLEIYHRIKACDEL